MSKIVTLRYTEGVTKFVNYADLEVFISESFKLPRHFEIFDRPNDTSYNFDVSKMGLEDDEMDACLAAIKKGSTQYRSLGNLLDFLCALGHIDAGKYVVSVSW